MARPNEVADQETLRRLKADVLKAQGKLDAAVCRMRRRKDGQLSYGTIARALGVSRQATQKKYAPMSGEDRKLIGA